MNFVYCSLSVVPPSRTGLPPGVSLNHSVGNPEGGLPFLASILSRVAAGAASSLGKWYKVASSSVFKTKVPPV